MNTLRFKLLIAFGIAVLVFIGVGLFIFISSLVNNEPEPSYNDFLRGQEAVREIIPPRKVTDFTLVTQTGGKMSLSDFGGQHVVMFFGYTYCPDVCPLTVFDLLQVNKLLGADAEDVAFLFISIDSGRDTPETLTRFFDARNMTDTMIGMVADADTLGRISADYRLFYEVQGADDKGYYTVDHSANIYLLDPQGRLTYIFGFGTAPEIIADQIRDLL